MVNRYIVILSYFGQDFQPGGNCVESDVSVEAGGSSGESSADAVREKAAGSVVTEKQLGWCHRLN